MMRVASRRTFAPRLPERRTALRTLYGGLAPPPPPTLLAALGGRVVAAIAADGSLRSLSVDGEKVLDGAAFLVRDAAWGTPPTVLDAPPALIEGEGVESVAMSGAIHGLRFDASLTLSTAGEAESDAATLSYEVRGVAGAALSSARCGFIVLHPAAVAGLPVCVNSEGDDADELDFLDERQVCN